MTAPETQSPRQAVRDLANDLAAQVRDDMHGFVRGDLLVRERFGEMLQDRKPGCFRKREQLGTLRYTVHRDSSNRRLIDLHEVAADMLGFEPGKWRELS